ncbi:MAG: glycosyltransferase [Sphingobacteriaceae bacterium]|nr:MAG: glycosyltransferase [Sphingobacteriaceae bacterium]
MNTETQVPVVFMPCSGLGHINRGYESFTIQCFENLKDSKEFRLILLKAVGTTSTNELNIACIRRDSKMADRIFKIFKIKQYLTEQISFCLNMLPAIVKYKPALIYYSDTPSGKILEKLRKLFGFKYKLLLCNGAPKLAPFNAEDHIQQLLQVSIDKAAASGTPLNEQTLLPLGLNINTKPDFQNIDKTVLKAKLNVPADKKIIISVGAVSPYQKRMDYVVKEFSHLDHNKYFLIILGNISHDSKPVLDLATSLLPPKSYIIKQVKSNEVSDYLFVADYFTLASFSEGFGLVLIEALQSGLIPIVHDYDVVHEVLQQYAIYGDLSKENVMFDLIKKVDQLNYTKDELWKYAYQNYSWKILKEQYVKMISANLYR